MLSWFFKHGLESKVVYKTMCYKANKNFEWFIEQVTEARQTGDT